MGRVTENKRRNKLSADPNNTRWARNEQSFGQRILRSHGWQPGAVLGAVDATHAEFYTDGSSTHIRAKMREDGTGLGFVPAGALDPATEGRHPGMDVLEQVLARLNGKTATVAEEERRRRDEDRRKNAVARRYGVIRFVSGGFLVGDTLEELKEDTVNAGLNTQRAIATEAEAKAREEDEGKSKKRTRTAAETEQDSLVDDATARKKLRRAEKALQKAVREREGMVTKDRPKEKKADTREDRKPIRKSRLRSVSSDTVDISSVDAGAEEKPNKSRKRRTDTPRATTSLVEVVDAVDAPTLLSRILNEQSSDQTDDGKRRCRKGSRSKEQAVSRTPTISKSDIVAQMRALLEAESGKRLQVQQVA